MMISRRNFIKYGSVSALIPSAIFATESPGKVLRASESTTQLLPDTHPPTAVWSYNETVPGSEIRTQQGKGVDLRFVNNLNEPTSVHWHGIRLENAMDGVPGLTQETVKPDEYFDYHFRTPDAGTYWYHSHHRSWEQMARGLYGALIVEEPNPPETDVDKVLLLDDWRLQEDGQIVENFGGMMDLSHAGRQGNWLTVNGIGMDRASMQVKQNQRIRLRLANVANASIFTFKFDGLTGWVIAIDGQPLEEVRPLAELTMSPAQRVDVIIDVHSEKDAQLSLETRDGYIRVMRFPVEGKERQNTLAKPDPLPANPLPEIGNLKDLPVTELTMSGGAMGGMRSAIYQEKEMGIQELVQHGMVWAFNGVAGMSDTPLFHAGTNETVRIRLLNNTSWPHGIHMHGHHFREVLSPASDAGPELGPWRDTILINRNEQKEIAFVADNPGKWLLHCHMLGHQAAGMKTWFEVG